MACLKARRVLLINIEHCGPRQRPWVEAQSGCTDGGYDVGRFIPKQGTTQTQGASGGWFSEIALIRFANILGAGWKLQCEMAARRLGFEDVDCYFKSFELGRNFGRATEGAETMAKGLEIWRIGVKYRFESFGGKIYVTLCASRKGGLRPKALEDLGTPNFATSGCNPGDVVGGGRGATFGKWLARVSRAVTCLTYKESWRQFVAKSFARILFFGNGIINQGLLLITCPEAVDGGPDGTNSIEIDIPNSLI